MNSWLFFHGVIICIPYLRHTDGMKNKWLDLWCPYPSSRRFLTRGSHSRLITSRWPMQNNPTWKKKIWVTSQTYIISMNYFPQFSSLYLEEEVCKDQVSLTLKTLFPSCFTVINNIHPRIRLEDIPQFLTYSFIHAPHRKIIQLHPEMFFIIFHIFNRDKHQNLEE